MDGSLTQFLDTKPEDEMFKGTLYSTREMINFLIFCVDYDLYLYDI